MVQNKQNSEVEAKKCISLLAGDISTYPYSASTIKKIQPSVLV
jgi:hypothetical protein